MVNDTHMGIKLEDLNVVCCEFEAWIAILISLLPHTVTYRHLKTKQHRKKAAGILTKKRYRTTKSLSTKISKGNRLTRGQVRMQIHRKNEDEKASG
jgi:hypothetical protein